MTNDRHTDTDSPPDPALFWFERRGAGDFPFYRGTPRALSGWHWVLVLLGVGLGFAALIAPIDIYRTTAGGFLAVVLFFAIPLGALALVAGSDWRSLFRRLRLRDLFWMMGVAAANILVSIAVVLLVRKYFAMGRPPCNDIPGDDQATHDVASGGAAGSAPHEHRDDGGERQHGDDR